MSLRNMEGMEVRFHSLVMLALKGDEWSASRNGRFTFTENVSVSH